MTGTVGRAAGPHGPGRSSGGTDEAPAGPGDTPAGPDGRPRCPWALGDERYRRYHDEEWGRPVARDDRLYEKVCLEGFQSGLSWRTILHKRPAFRDAFDGFDIETVARYGARDVERLAGRADIVRNRAKIEAAVHNARRALALREETGRSLAAFFWAFEPKAAERPATLDRHWLDAHPTTEASTRLAAALKARGWKYVGPTTMYALMQALGLVNDHVEGCWRRADVERERRAFVRPA